MAGIDHEPAFNWWVPHVLKKRDRIISMVKGRSARYHKRTHKFGIAVPKTVRDAQELDRQNGNTLWVDAIAKEMKDVRKAFNILPDDKAVPIGYQKIPCHMIFDVKMEDFKRKARLVAGGHRTEAPATITYASIVSRETVRIALMLAALNDLQVKAGDVLNAYVSPRMGTISLCIRGLLSSPCLYAYGVPHMRTAIPICILSHMGVKSLISHMRTNTLCIQLVTEISQYA